MKVRCAVFLVAMLVACMAAAGAADQQTTRRIAEISSAISSADLIEFVDMSTLATEYRAFEKDGTLVRIEMPPQIKCVSIRDRSQIEAFAADLRLSPERLRAGVEVVDEKGVPEVIYPPCQCLGDFQCRILRKNERVLAFTIHHDGVFIRTSSGSSIEEFDIIPPFGARIVARIQEALRMARADAGAGRLGTPATEKNSVPIRVWAEYCARDGDDYRFEHSWSVDAGTITRYWLNWHYDAEPKTEPIEISTTAWIRFREALRDAGCDRWREEKFDRTTTQPFWILYVVYPDVTIRAASLNATEMEKDFASVKKALHELTGGKAF